jgi:ParB-like chromosome segregation protein Spo0J
LHRKFIIFKKFSLFIINQEVVFMHGLIQPSEERKLFERLVAYYKKIHKDVGFKTEEIALRPEELGEIYYTYPGEETEATFNEEVEEIEKSLDYGYDTPIILIRKDGKDILLDGHRRVKVAWTKKLQWKALVMVPDKEIEFGIEKMILGKVKEKFAPASE